MYCAYGNTNNETKKYFFEGEKIIRIHETLQSPTYRSDNNRCIMDKNCSCICKMPERDDCHIVVSSGPGCCRACRGANTVQRVSKGAITLQSYLRVALALELANTC